MMMARRISTCLLVLAAFAAVWPAHGAVYHVILSGAGGEERFSERFIDWSTRLRGALIEMGYPEERILLFTEKGAGSGSPEPVAIELEAIRDTFGRLSGTITPSDLLFVYFIGHGSYLRDDSKFHIPGPDLTAKETDQLFESIKARQLVVINSASTSAGWINELSAPQRIICTSTKSIDQSNATEFMEHFVTALEDGTADRNHDDRISVLEACQQGAELTAAWFTENGLIATENALLDDNGDGLGSRLPIMPIAEGDFAAQTDEGMMPVFDGEVASSVYLKEFEFPPSVPQPLIDEYLSAIGEIEAFKKTKGTQEEEVYYATLEPLFLRAAKVNRQIRGYIEGDEVPESPPLQ